MSESQGSLRAVPKRRAHKVAAADDRFDDHVQAFDLESSFGFLFRRLNSLANALFAASSGQTEITPMQMGVLLAVQQNGLISLRELTRKMKVDRSTLQEVVKRMVDKGLLSRRSPANDKRAHEVWLAADGIELVRKHMDAIEKMQERLLEGLPVDEQQITLKCLKFILDHHGY